MNIELLNYENKIVGKFQKLSWGTPTLDMTSEGLGQMFEGDSADMFGEKFLLVSMGGWAKGIACADPGTRAPIGAAEILFLLPPMTKIRGYSYSIDTAQQYQDFQMEKENL